MPNNHVFTGLDGAITVAVEVGVEGDAAKAVTDTYGLTPIATPPSCAAATSTSRAPSGGRTSTAHCSS